MNKETFISLCNKFSQQSIPFLFITDFELQVFHIHALNEIDPESILYQTPVGTNAGSPQPSATNLSLGRSPMQYEEYLEAFNFVKKNIQHGNSFLLNLTFPTRLEMNVGLKEIFERSVSKYKLFYKDQFVVFSPESFIKISGNSIHSYPMKGTIDAAIPGAEQKILSDKKEQWEHNTIVDLIRNDLSLVSKNVRVERFRYLERINTSQKNLLQVSSEVVGDLPSDWKSKLGEIIVKQLPAGSVSGAPKKKTLELIYAAEKVSRGYFTGIFGIFDGNQVDSAVMIRYIEKTDEGIQYRSGGGITGHSDSFTEYNEMLDKVYVPIL